MLVDRLWPRGLTKQAAALDGWMREVAPSDALRRRFHQDSTRWEEFCGLYHAELDAAPEAVRRLRAMIAAGPVTLLFAARDEARNNAVVLADYLKGGGISADDS